MDGLTLKLVLLATLCCMGCDPVSEIYEVQPGFWDKYDQDGFHAMKKDLQRNKILESVSINILGKEYCVDVVRDWRQVKVGFVKFDDSDNIPKNLWISTDKYNAFAFEDDLIFIGIRKPEGMNLPVCGQSK